MHVTHVIVAKRTCKAYASPTGKIVREKYRDTQICQGWLSQRLRNSW